MNSLVLLSLAAIASLLCSPVLIAGLDNPLISRALSTRDLVASANDVVNLTCVTRKTAKVIWYFTDQHLAVLSYAGDSGTPVVLASGQAYREQPLRPVIVGNATDLYVAVTLSVRVSEQTYGHYQCMANSDDVSTTAEVHDLYLRINSLATVSFNQTAYSTCCLNSGVAEACKPFCEPWKLAATSDIVIKMMSCMTSNRTTKIRACGLGNLGGSNVGRCCARREVPTSCLVMCRETPILPSTTGSVGNSVCYNSTVLADIFTCHSDGFVSVPGPPVDVDASLDAERRRISVKWKEPLANPQLVKGYSVHWKANAGDANFYSNASMSILVGSIIYLPSTGSVASSYSVYAQSIGEHGTSVPSPTTTTVGPLVVPNITVTPVMKCCQDNNLTSRCAERLCSGRPILDLNEIINSSCGKNLGAVFACYAGGRNHTSCCLREGVPSACGKFCSGENPHISVDDTSICLPYLDAIARCYDTGAAGIPSPPRQLSLDGITDRSVSVRWLPPLYGSTLVRNYSLLVIDKVTGWRTAVSTVLTEHTVQGLVSDRFYELAVVAVGNVGTSLASNRMTVMTMDSAPSTQPPGGNSGQPDFPRCCSQLLVPSNCSEHCNVNFNPLALSDYCKQAALPALLACLTDGRNNTPCCQARNVPANCQAACRFRPADPATPPYCQSVLPIVQNCARAAYSDVPSEPTHLTVQSYGTNFVDLAWQLPTRRPMGVSFRYVLSADVELSGTTKTQVSLAKFPADVTVGHVVSLEPGGRYTFRMAAVSDVGSSLFSDPVSVWLLPDLPNNWSASGNVSHLPFGISQCCKAKKVPDQCQLLCDPRNMTNWNHTDSTLSRVYNNCTASLPDISYCLADGKNHEVCCKREKLPEACLGLCSGSPVPSGSLICPLWWREIYGCIEEGYIGVPSPPIIHRVDVFSSRLSVTFDRNTADASVRSILYIRYADVPSHWYAFLNPANPAMFRVPSNTSFSVFMLNSNTNGSSQPSPVYTVRTTPEHPLNMYISSNTSSFRILEGSTTVALTCFYSSDSESTATYMWYRSGDLLQFGSSSNYIIPHPESRNSGVYTCAVRLSTGQAGSVSASLHVQSPVSAAALTGLVPALPGQFVFVRLTCVFEGYPDRVDWRDPAGVPIVAAASVRVPLPTISDLLTYSSVEFTAITAAQFGDYTCTGINKMGSHSAGIRLYNSADASMTTPAPPTVGPLPTSAGVAPSVSCCKTRGVSDACIAVCDPAAAAAAVASATPQCTRDFDNHGSHCLALSRNFTLCCQAHGVPSACLPLCWGDPPAAVCSLALAVAASVVTCLGSSGVPGPPRTPR